MSADNGIYILVTKDTHKKTNPHTWTNTFGEGIIAYRVAHAQGIDNLRWYEKNQRYNVGYFLHCTFGGSEPVYSFEEAHEIAYNLEKEIGYTEHGVCTISRLEYAFPW